MSTTPQPLSALVSVHTRYARSVHLERDHRRTANHDYYVTESARQLLQTVVYGLDHPAERAMTVVGPYGAGKSACCMFVAEVLAGSEPVLATLQSADPHLAERLVLRNPRLVPVPVVGARQPLGKALVGGLLRALESGHHAALSGRIGTQAIELLLERDQAPRKVAELFVRAAREACGVGQGGLLLMIDELGKFLEYAALHPHEGDVFLLQELAEAAARSGDAPLLLLGVLHQNADAYAQKLGRSQQTEWAKVGERFRPVNFFPSDSERIEIVGRALRHAPELALNGRVSGICERYGKLELPGGGLLKRFPAMARAAYPLHPLTLLALPALFRRAGQSHRSLFNFLAAEEPHALGSFLRDQVYAAEAPPFYTLDRLFDYAAEVLLGAWQTSTVVRLWADAAESVERAASLDVGTRRVLKAIALLNTLKEPRLPASPELLALALDGHGLTAGDVWAALESLEKRRLVVWSRARNSYRLWEGGDVDVEAELSSARRSLSAATTVHVASKLCPPPRLVARRHSYLTGTMRLVAVRPCSTDRLPATLHEAGDDLTLVLCLAANAEDEERARGIAAHCARRNILIGIARETDALQEAAADIAASEQVTLRNEALQNDRAARRELSARRGEAEQAFVAEWGRLFGPDAGEENWWRLGSAFSLDGERAFSSYLSEMADSTYHATPRLRNELINRRSLSSAAAAGRRNLLEAMLIRASERNLGIQQFPPELSMYQCVLEATGIHQEVSPGLWAFVAPAPGMGAGSLRPVWLEIERLLFGGPPDPVPLTEVYARLSGPPYGVTEGVLPVLLCAFMLAQQDATTLYRDGTFLPEPSVADFEVLVRRPELFAMAGCRVHGDRQAVVERLARGLNTAPAVVPIVRALLRMVKSFPDFAWKTQRLPTEVLAFREQVSKARSPERFLFQDLPAALNVTPLADEPVNCENVEAFFGALNAALRTWGQVSHAAVQAARDALLDACGMPPGEEGWGQLRARAGELEGSITHPVLGPFIRRLAEPRDTAGSVDSVLALVANRPPRSWTDADVKSFVGQARVVGELFFRTDAALRAPVTPHLKPQQALQSREVATVLRAQLPRDVPPQVLRAALLALAEEMQAAPAGGLPDE